MEELEIAGQIIGGKVASILLREKSGKRIELGDLLVVDEPCGKYLILQVYDLAYGSQIPQSMRELAAGLKLEGYGNSLDFLEPQLRNYVMAMTKALAFVSDGKGTYNRKIKCYSFLRAPKSALLAAS